MVRRTAVIAALVAGCTAAGAMVPAHAADEPRRYLSGWLPYWSMPASTSSFTTNADLFSDISPFWHEAKWDGSKVYLSNHRTDAQITSELAALRGQGVKILPAITDGTGKGRMAATLDKPATRTAHVRGIVDLVLAKGYDGIDLDYEGFAFADGQASWSATRPDWVAFVTELSQALHAEGKLLAVTVPPMGVAPGDYWVYDWAGIAEAVDVLRIMAYDYSVSRPGPIAPLPWVKKVAAYAAKTMPKAKVQLGIPVYGRSWYVDKTGTCPVGVQIKNTNTSFTSGRALATLAADGVRPEQITRDPESGELTVSYSIEYPGLDAEGKKTSCTVNRRAFFADATSVADRVGVARAEGLGGAALWTIGGEAADQWPALRKAVGTVKDDPGAPRPATVSIGAPKFVTRGQTGSFTAAVTVDGNASGGGQALLQANPRGKGGWRQVAQQSVPDDGRVVFTHAPARSAAFRIQVPASGGRQEARSAAVTTRVRAAVSVNSSVVAFTGQKVRLTGSITPGRRGVTVVRQRLVDGRWRTFGSVRTGRGGTYRFKVTPTVKNANYTYRVVSMPFDGFARGYSPTVSFRAR